MLQRFSNRTLSMLTCSLLLIAVVGVDSTYAYEINGLIRADYQPRFSLVKPLTVTNRQVIRYRGDAFDLKTGNTLLYRELHTLHLENGKPSKRSVRYERPNGELMALKDSKYSDELTAPDFTLNDVRDGYQEEVEKIGNRRRLTVRENATSEPVSKRLSAPEFSLVVDAGFDEFVRNNWSRLITGKTTSFSFAVPARQQFVNFRLITSNTTASTLEVEMKLKSRLFAWLVDPIRLSYDLETKQLLRYRGLTNMRDDQGKGITADIRYYYPEVSFSNTTSF